MISPSYIKRSPPPYEEDSKEGGSGIAQKKKDGKNTFDSKMKTKIKGTVGAIAKSISGKENEKEINEIKVTDEQPSGCFATIITPEIQSGKVQKTKTAECIHEKTDSSKEYETEKVSGDNSETTIFSKGDRIEKCKHKKKMGTEVEEPNLTLRMPVDVDSSDGINLEEFRKLQEIAEQLFNKHLSSFDKAFAMRKWKTDRKDNISKCFRSYWLELGELIFRDNNNGKLTLM